MLLFIFLLASLLNSASASFCGEGFMGYSFSVSFGGQFTLGCAQPSCLKFPIIENPTFAYVNGVKDGFVDLPLINEATFVNDRAECEPNFYSTNCTQDGQWLAGIAPISDLSNFTSLSLRCCKHWALKVAKFQKVVTLFNGESYQGGDILDDNEDPTSFDYITNIIKIDIENNNTKYEVVVNRLPCSAIPQKDEDEFNKRNITNKIHQAPIVEAGEDKYQAPDAGDDYGEELVENDRPKNDATTAKQEYAEVTALPLGDSTADYSESMYEEESDKIVGEVEAAETTTVAAAIPQQQQQQQQSINLNASLAINNSLPDSGVNQYQTSYPNSGSQTANSGYIQPQQPLQNQQYVQAPPMLQPQYQAPFYPMQPLTPLFMSPSIQAQSSPNSASNYYPVAQQSQQAAGGGGQCCQMMCFTGDTLVTLSNGTKKRMDELQISDWVVTAGGNTSGISQVNSWLHRKPELVTDFIKFTLESGHELKITKRHYIFKGTCKGAGSSVNVDEASQNLVYAEDVEITDCLFVMNKGYRFIKTRITKIETIRVKGIYAPMTNNGNIVVNDIFASCYNLVKNEKVQYSVTSVSRSFQAVFAAIWNYLTLGFDFNEVDVTPGFKNLAYLAKYVIPN